MSEEVETEGEPTARTAAIYVAGNRGDVKALAHELSQLRGAVVALSKTEHQREGAARVWRALGTIAATVAITLGGWALALGQEAAVDHERLNRNVADVSAHEARLDEQRRTLSEVERDAAASDATQNALAQAVNELTAEVRTLRSELSRARR